MEFDFIFFPQVIATGSSAERGFNPQEADPNDEDSRNPAEAGSLCEGSVAKSKPNFAGILMNSTAKAALLAFPLNVDLPFSSAGRDPDREGTENPAPEVRREVLVLSAPAAGLEPATRRLTAVCSTN